MDFHRGAQHLADYRRFLGEFLSPDVNIGEAVHSVFKEYRKDVGKSDPSSTRRLLGDVNQWTGIEFGRDVQSQLKNLKVMGPVAADRAWAILYCLRFMDAPDSTRGKSRYPVALGYAEQIERLILSHCRKGQRTYRTLNAGKGPPHPTDPHPKEPIEADPTRLPARFFEFRPPENFQKERDEFREVRATLLKPNARSVALVTAVMGPGGYGKTAIAEEIAIDPDIKRAFPGGIYWLQFGLRFGNDGKDTQEHVNSQDAINSLLAKQYPDIDTSRFDLSSPEKLFETLPDDHILIIADDIWNSVQAAILSKVPDRITVLATTRNKEVVKHAREKITIDRLGPDTSFALLTFGMGALTETQDANLGELCEKFRGWPLLLDLANGHFRKLSDEGGSVEDAIEDYRKTFEDQTVVGWDDEEPGVEDNQLKRRTLARLCIETGLSAVLSSEQRRLFEALAVFPDDTDIPFEVLDLLWAEMSRDLKQNDRIRPSILRLRASNYSLFREYSTKNRTFRLHDEMLSYLRGSFKADESKELHATILQSLSRSCSADWSKLPEDNSYGWTYLLQHMENAGCTEDANALRVSFAWLKSLFSVHEVEGLFFAFRSDQLDDASVLVRRAIHRSAHILRIAPDQLPLQFYGRLGHVQGVDQIEQLAKQALDCSNANARPRWPHLDSLEHEHLVLADLTGRVVIAAFNRDGTKIVTASEDGTAQLWDAETGAAIGEVLQGHTEWLFIAMFNRDSTKIMTASSDRTARLWDAETGATVGEVLETRPGLFFNAEFNRDGTKVVTASDDGTAQLWDAETGTAIGDVLKGHTDWVTSAVFNRDGTKIVTVSNDRTARLWDAETGAAIGDVLKGHTGRVTSAAFNREGTKVVTASSDRTARLWESVTGAAIEKVLQGHTDWVTSAVFNKDGTKIVTTSRDKTARLWDVETGLLIGDALKDHSGSVTSAAFNREGTKVLTVSTDQTARLWDAETGLPIGDVLKGHTGCVESAAFSRDGTKVVTASSDKTARLWDAETGLPIGGPLKGHSDSVTSAAFNRDGTKILTASDDGSARLWDMETGAAIETILKGRTGWIESAAFSRDGTKAVTVSDDTTTRLWDTETGLPIGEVLKGHTGWVESAAFSRDGTKVVTASSDKTARLWDADTGLPIGGALKGHSDSVTSAAFNRDGTKIVTASRDKTARLWDAESGLPFGDALKGHKRRVNSAAFNRNGTKIVTASSDRTARLWDAETGLPIGSALKGHSGSVTSAVFNRDGTKVLTVSTDQTARLWDTETGFPIGDVLKGHTGWVESAVFSRDGTKVVTASSDKTARLWDAETGLPIGGALKGHLDSVTSAAFNRDGTKIVTASEDGSARLWDPAQPENAYSIQFDVPVNEAVFGPNDILLISSSNTICVFEVL